MALYSKRIGSKTLMVSDHPEKPNLCYKWTKSGKPAISGLRYVCAGCRKLRDAKHVAKESPLPTRKVVGGNWADDGPSNRHFCQPYERTKVQGEEERRKVQAELAFGSRENVASAKVRIDARVAQNYSDKAEEERNQIRDTACGNSKATKKALYRAQTKRFTRVQTLHGLANDDCRSLWMTLRAKTAVPNSPHFDEILLRHLDDELAIFASKRAPSTGTSGLNYGRSWKKLTISQANFDFEPASVEAFRQNFFDVRVKMCCFHVRQALQRRIQRMGLAQLYISREDDGLGFQRLIRKIGALQFCPPNYMNRSIHVLRGLINGCELELAVRVATNDILDYYVSTWVRNSIGPEFFNLFDVPRHRTINHAESYHGRQRWFYQPHQLLGRWLINFQEVSHAEEETAVAIEEGRQQPNHPLAMTAEIDAGIEREKANVLAFLHTDFEEEQFVETLSRYFGHIGHLIGFNAPPMTEMDEQAQEALALEEAEASLDESGLFVESIDGENIAPN